MACRNKEKGEEACKKIKEVTGKTTVEVMTLDLCSLKSVREFASNFLSKNSSLGLLINNAGVMNIPYAKTEDGFETTLAANHLGHFLLTNLLLDTIKKSAPSRIVNLSSFVAKDGHMNFDDLMGEKHYDQWGAYTQSKLANILFTVELTKRLEGTGVSTYAVNPGFVRTELLKTISPAARLASKVAGKSPDEGAKTALYVALSPDVEKQTGKYWSDCAEHHSSDESRNEEIAKKLWDVSAQLVKLE